MALLRVSHPPVQTCGGEDILYFYISWTPRVLDPVTNPSLGGPGCIPLQSAMTALPLFTTDAGPSEVVAISDNSRLLSLMSFLTAAVLTQLGRNPKESLFPGPEAEEKSPDSLEKDPSFCSSHNDRRHMS